MGRTSSRALVPILLVSGGLCACGADQVSGMDAPVTTLSPAQPSPQDMGLPMAGNGMPMQVQPPPTMQGNGAPPAPSDTGPAVDPQPFPNGMPAPSDAMPPGPTPDEMMPVPTPNPDMQPTTPAAGSGDISSCTPPPDGASATAVEAWTMLNEIRLASGSTCIDMVPELNDAAQSHCDYRQANSGNRSCTPDGHTQVQGCTGFTGATVGAREVAAGYPRQLAYTEVSLSYGDRPAAAIPGWLVTPFHRIPLLDPWTTDMGWGGGPGCDIIDLGRGTAGTPDDATVVYPYNGQTDVPTSFNGLEAPMPPMPAGGWPSSYPVSLYAKGMNITEHVLTKDGDETPIEHLWLDANAPEVDRGLRPYFSTTAMFYGAPFEANTTYRVRISGTYVGGPLNLEWTFTTGAASRGWF